MAMRSKAFSSRSDEHFKLEKSLLRRFFRSASSVSGAEKRGFRRLPRHVATPGPLRIAAAALFAVLALTSCKKILNKGEDTFHTRMVNLIQDSPAVQYKIDTTAVANTTYQGVTALAAARPGDHSVSFQAERPTSLVSTDTTDPIDLGSSFSRTYVKNTDYTIFAYGKMSNIQTMITEAPSGQAAVVDDNIEVTVVNASASQPTLTVYVTVPNAGITSPTSIGTINPGEKTAAKTMKLTRPADSTDTTSDLTTALTFEIHDASGAVIFTSPALTLTEKIRYTFAITPNIGPGPSPVQMVGIDGSTGVYTNTTDQAVVRLVHVSAATPALDVYRASVLTAPIITNVAFRDASPYVAVPDGTIDLLGVPAGSTALQFLFIKEFAVIQGESLSFYVTGPASAVAAVPETDNTRSVPTQASYRFLLAAPSQSGQTGFDVYVTTPGLTLDFNASTSVTTDDAAQFKRATGLVYQNVTDYSTYKPDTYQVRVMATGTTTVLLDTTITLAAGGVTTYVINDDPDTGGLELIPVADATT